MIGRQRKGPRQYLHCDGGNEGLWVPTESRLFGSGRWVPQD
jgi:hypothetical protein